MAKENKDGWTVRAVGVSFIDGVRRERPLEDFTKAELKEIAARKNMEALKAAGYIPVAERTAAAM